MTMHKAKEVRVAPSCSSIYELMYSLLPCRHFGSSCILIYDWERPSAFPRLLGPVCSTWCTEWLEHMASLGPSTAFLVSSPGWILWISDAIDNAARARRCCFSHCNKRPHKMLKLPMQVVYQVSSSPMTHCRVFQVSNTMPIGLQWPQTTHFHVFID